tara:strand:+ start:382 stop:684 length:303 start_codon:yes stop_codon:yes gene_type:complete
MKPSPWEASIGLDAYAGRMIDQAATRVYLGHAHAPRFVKQAAILVAQLVTGQPLKGSPLWFRSALLLRMDAAFQEATHHQPTAQQRAIYLGMIAAMGIGK